MLPFLTFASGIVAGIVGVQLLKKARTPQNIGDLGTKARSGLDKAGAGLRDATVSSLSAIEKSSASLRAKLTPEAAPEAEAPAETPDEPTAPAEDGDAADAAPPSRRKAAGKKKPEADAEPETPPEGGA